jgi:YHS domain-containing protein
MKMRILPFIVAACVVGGTMHVSAAITDILIQDDQSRWDALVEENLALKETVSQLENKVSVLQTLLRNYDQRQGEEAPSPLPDNSKIGMEGFDPVVLVEQQRWETGDRKCGADHHGWTYLFSSDETRKKFLNSPGKYTPVLDGCDPIEFLQGRTTAGSRRHGLYYHDRIFLFASEVNLNQFVSNPNRISDLNLQSVDVALDSKETPQKETTKMVPETDKQERVFYSGARARRHFRR